MQKTQTLDNKEFTFYNVYELRNYYSSTIEWMANEC